MSTIPKAIVEMIIQHLHRSNYYQCALVNRQFYKVVNPILWQKVILTRNLSVATRLIESLETNYALGQFIQHAQFYQQCPLTDTAALTFIKNTPNLLEWNFVGTPKTTTTTLSSPPPPTPFNNRTETILLQLDQYCPHLQSLEITGAQWLTQQTLTSLTKLHHLQTLTLDNCAGVTCDLFSTGAATLNLCHYLRHLTIRHCCDFKTKNGDDKRLGYTAILDLARLFGLTRLVLDQGPYCDFSGCLQFVHAWPFLTCLELSDCSSLSDQLAIVFIKKHPFLRNLVLSGAVYLTNKTLYAIGTYLPSIKVVGLIYNKKQTELGVRLLANRCKELEQIQLSGCGIKAFRFPEADIPCWGETEYIEQRLPWGGGGGGGADYLVAVHELVYLDHLDHDAIYKIKRNLTDGYSYDDYVDAYCGDDSDFY